MKSAEASGTSRVRRVPTFLLEILHGGGRSRVTETGGDIESGGARERAYLMKTNAAEAEYRVACGVRLRDLDVLGQKRALQRVDALLRVVRSHWFVGIGGRRRRSGSR